MIDLNNPVVIEYIDFLLRIEKAQSTGDEEEADRLCEEADPLAENLSAEEAKWTAQLSEDLYSLSDSETFRGEEISQDNLNLLTSEAYNSQDAETMLWLLRRPCDVSTDRRSVMRSIVYQMIGLHSIAIAFMEYAVSQQPDNVQYKVMMLDRYLRGEEYSKFIKVAGELQGVELNVRLRMYAGALCQNLIASRSGDYRAARQYCIGFIEPILNNGQVFQLDKDDVANAYALVGLAYQSFGNKSLAFKYVDLAVHHSNNDPDMLAVRGATFMVFHEEDRGLLDFEKATLHGTHSHIAHLVTARELLAREEFNRCLLIIQRLINLEPTSDIRANAYTMQAICYLNLGYKSNSVRRSIQNAMRLDTENHRIREVYSELEKALSLRAKTAKSPQSQLNAWSIPSLADYKQSIADYQRDSFSKPMYSKRNLDNQAFAMA